MTAGHLRLLATAVLIVGLGSAAGIFLAAETAPEGAPGSDPQDSKQYVRAMEYYGGKANLLAAELVQWLQSLWHGRRLAYTVAAATVLTAGALWLVAAAES